ncbi:myrosinase 1-like [Anoplophora glabripennis]|uniref:myrosinase 1-like n=1 Tax=Anoplophora glabripennis TaxID=217634 RepID=UPI000874E744|nr:myrosinase 1-like [Anoplophora glabripennis]
MYKALLVFPLILTVSSFVTAENNPTFPDGFLFGVATAAYQIEGAWNEDGKGESIWDHFVHSNASVIQNNDTGDIACDSYHKYKEDIALAKELGVNHYRFSVSWTRILPTGFADQINVKGIMYYQNLVNEIVKQGMIPVATLYHWDLPQSLQDIGGWTNPELVHHFVNYSRIVIESLDQVGYWITINEPRPICQYGYGAGAFAPGIALDGIGEYLCAYVLVKAHAAVYHMYKTEFPDLKAKMSITFDGEWYEPASDNDADKEAAERRKQFEFGLYANPILNGNWPQVVVDRVKYRSENGNYSKSRLPEFTEEEIAYINGTFDFIGLNTYYTLLVADAAEGDFANTSSEDDIRATASTDPSWPVAPNGNTVVPWGARKYLKWVKDTYNNPDILITENGVADDGSTLEDDDRISFYQDYLKAILDAMYEDEVKVFGYTAWSLLDNFEWTKGYSAHFGLYHVNFTDPDRKRTAKKSASYYKFVATTHELPEITTTNVSPESTTHHGSANKVFSSNVLVVVLSFIYMWFKLM